MSLLDGYDSSDFASFDNVQETPKQLPSLPVDDVLPQADAQTKKSVSFEEDTYDNIAANVILPKKEESEPKPKIANYLQNVLEEYGPYLFAIIFILVAYWYSQYY